MAAATVGPVESAAFMTFEAADVAAAFEPFVAAAGKAKAQAD